MSPSFNSAYDVLKDLDSRENAALSPEANSRLFAGRECITSHALGLPIGLNTPQLSPLIQHTPICAVAPKGESSTFSYEKIHHGSVADNFMLETGMPNASQISVRRNKEKWSDSDTGLGQVTWSFLIAVGLGFLGFLIFIGKAVIGINVTETGISALVHHVSQPAESTLATFPFSPSHYLHDCPIVDVQRGSTQKILAALKAQDVFSKPANNTYFSSTESTEVTENIKPSETHSEGGKKICDKSLTYLLDDDFGFAFHMNAISFAVSLAEKDSRDFFIVDAEWDRGFWTDHFMQKPSPDCAPPPPSEMVGCPRSAKHWILTSSIFSSHFSEEFQSSFGDNDEVDKKTLGPPSGIIPYTRKSIYEMSRSAFLRTFILSEENENLIRMTKQEIINSAIWGTSADGGLPPFISVHVRKGDRHPHDPLHKFDYIPINTFIDTINSTWVQLSDADSTLPKSPNVFLASDTPLVLEQLRALTPTTWKFFHISEAKAQKISQIAHPHEYSQLHFHAHVPSERKGYTRGQIIDMAFLGGGWPQLDGSVVLSTTDSDKPLASICTVSSNMCQFGALQLGWQEAFENSKWVNLDLPLTVSWTGIEIPPPNTGDSNPNGHGHGGAHHSHKS